jgi:hypothetical protein
LVWNRIEIDLLYERRAVKIEKVPRKVVKNKEMFLQHVSLYIKINRYFFFATFYIRPVPGVFFYYCFVPLATLPHRSWLKLILQAIEAQFYDTFVEIYSNKVAQKEFGTAITNELL